MSDAKKKILVVEDEDNLRELVQNRLENEGFEVTTAADGFQAIGKARQSQPDLVILDLMIPKMDGYSVCRLFRSGGMAQTPIIIFSARSSPEDVRRGLDMVHRRLGALPLLDQKAFPLRLQRGHGRPATLLRLLYRPSLSAP